MSSDCGQRRHRSHRFHTERFNVRKLNMAEGKGKYHNEVKNKFAALEDLGAGADINNA
jgi:hypothetical protein